MTGESYDYVFTRRILNDGTKTRFYTRDFAHVATLAASLRRYSTREVRQMDKTEHLMQRLGHVTSKTTSSLINSGVQNCSVSTSEVRNKDTAKGVSVANLRGKTTKRKSISPGYVLAPRVTHVQQVFSIDIIFVKMIYLLLGVFTPLGFNLVNFLRDHSEDQVEIAVQMMLAKAVSISFDVLEIRCDGEETVGAISAALQAKGIRVVISGPGQHVDVVERMSRTPKTRHRCHELALPCVMPQTLILWCVQFCMNCINL